MCPVQKSPDDLAKEVAGAIVGLRPSDDRFHNLVDNAVQTYPGLGPEEFAGKVGAAARRTVMLRLILGGVVGLLLCIVVITVIAVGVIPWAKNPILKFLSSPTPTIVPTPLPVPWVFRGHIYRGQTQQGLEGVQVYLDIQAGNQWHEAVLSTTTDVSGSFTLTLPTQWEAKQEYRLRVSPPQPWKVTQARPLPSGWIWENANPDTLIYKIPHADTTGPVELEVKIQRVFTGNLYFQGEGAPFMAVIALLDLSDTLLITRSATRSVDPITLTSPLPIPFELEHDSIDADARYHIRVIDPAGAEWAASVPPDVGAVETRGLTVIPGSRTVITDIVFAGPFPITLTYEMATWDGWSGLDTSGVITREQPEQPRNARAYWPVYLPGGSGYEIWVGIPGGNSAVISYTLHWDDNGQPGDVVSNGQINPITQCGQINEDWQLGAAYPPESIGAGGLFWIVVDEGQAYQPEDCAQIPFQMQAWKVEVRRKTPGR